MKPPTPPEGLQEQLETTSDDKLEVERMETVEVVLFEYEDENVSFCISFEFVYTFTQSFDKEELLV